MNFAVEVDRKRVRAFMNGVKVLRTRVEMIAAGKRMVLLVLADIKFKYIYFIKTVLFIR